MNKLVPQVLQKNAHKFNVILPVTNRQETGKFMSYFHFTLSQRAFVNLYSSIMLSKSISNVKKISYNKLDEL